MDDKADTVEIFDMHISKLSYEQVCDIICERIIRREPGYIATPNVDHVCNYHRIPSFREVYNGAFLLLPDGTPIVWASRLFGDPLPQKLSGSDMVPRLCALAAGHGFSVHFFGGTDGAAEETAQRMQQEFPSLKVAGWYCPPFGFEKDPQESRKAVEAVRAAQPDICFVALGSPKQEFWMHRYHQESSAIVCLGIGGAFEFVSGRVRRAPAWVQATGLEWLWRLAHEPRRLWRRYLIDDLVFFKLLWGEYRKRRGRGRGTPPAVPKFLTKIDPNELEQ